MADLTYVVEDDDTGADLIMRSSTDAPMVLVLDGMPGVTEVVQAALEIYLTERSDLPSPGSGPRHRISC